MELKAGQFHGNMTYLVGHFYPLLPKVGKTQPHTLHIPDSKTVVAKETGV
jgi:hypothetical protein